MDLIRKKNGPSASEENITFLARGVELRGAIRVDGTVRIDGLLEGEIHTKGTVVVGDEGIVRGTVNTGTFVSSGKVKANVNATEKVQLLKPGVLIGEVRAPIFSIEEGAYFQGLSDMGPCPWTDQSTQVSGNVHDLTAHRSKAPAVSEKRSDL